MLNIPEYRNYSSETKIALMDNSTVAFLEQVERAGISAKELLIGYEVILIPNWVSGDNGDRSGGLLIGYVGLITVPVAYN